MSVSDIIGIAGLIVGPIGIFLFFYQQYLNKADFQIISKSRQRALNGEWDGSLTQNNKIKNEPVKNDCELILKAGKKKIKGQMIVRTYHGNNELGSNNHKINGRLIHSRFFKFQYDNLDGTIIQFGTFLLELTPDGKRIIGELLGFGPYSEKIVSGQIEFRKTKNESC